MTAVLDLHGLADRLGRFQRHLFRMEALPAYAVDSDGDDYHRYVRGELEPDWERKQPWLDRLSADRDSGKLRYRVRVLSAELTDYERYACEWGYAYNTQAGEDVRVLHRGEHPLPAGLVEREFWVVDDDETVAMHYDDACRFVSAEVLPTDVLRNYVDARDQAWAVAEPFGSWWARHPELHRQVVG